ncbi:hypothetical protein F4781DRAFT_434222 [Annulohypoxylon bovei var. microspora]|nr:hypothetical protein F4781DRAFT_434222 [Annulohypoxylon bovei var. microspora]
MGKKRDRWYERQAAAATQAREDANKPLAEKTVRSKKTELPFLPWKEDKPEEIDEETKKEREIDREWVREREMEWRKEREEEREKEREKERKREREKEKEKGKEKEKVKEKEKEEVKEMDLDPEDMFPPDFMRERKEQRWWEALKKKDKETRGNGFNIRDLVESGKIKPPGPLDQMDKELLVQADELEKKRLIQEAEAAAAEAGEGEEEVEVVEVRKGKGKGKEKVTEKGKGKGKGKEKER